MRRRSESTVYECPICEERQVGCQRCDDCHTFMRRVGIGGISPCCEMAVTFEELLDH